DYDKNQVVNSDTTYGFYRLYNYSGSVSAQTKLYGMFKPWSMFGEWTKKTIIRHVLTPSVSFTGAPDFGDPKYGYYTDLLYLHNGEVESVNYSPYSSNLYGVPGKGRSGSLNFSLDNNLEMKLPVAATDSTRKISLIDQLRLDMGYNFLADSMNWSDLRASIRLKWFGKSAITLQGVFDTYTYNENGVRINVPRWQAGKGIGRLRSTGTSYSYSLNNETFKKLFSKLSGKKKTDGTTLDENSEEEEDTDTSKPSFAENQDRSGGSLRKTKEKDNNYDTDGYYLATVPWNVNLSYSMSLAYDMRREVFNRETREYPYKISQTLGISGNVSPTKNWTLNFNTSYDFDNQKFGYMQCSITRKMHCWSMSASVIPVGPYQSYNFTIAVNSSMLQDLKYTQSSSYWDSMNWGN
ncbi:MAG: LPS-assembly protein LptD, partial [Candidatus Symbiothrix sp.]|nr:LPS-assembly protein LptD [Candidatus Symbiothrix sp.]